MASQLHWSAQGNSTGWKWCCQTGVSGPPRQCHQRLWQAWLENDSMLSSISEVKNQVLGIAIVACKREWTPWFDSSVLFQPCWPSAIVASKGQSRLDALGSPRRSSGGIVTNRLVQHDDGVHEVQARPHPQSQLQPACCWQTVHIQSGRSLVDQHESGVWPGLPPRSCSLCCAKEGPVGHAWADAAHEKVCGSFGRTSVAAAFDVVDNATV